MSNVFKCKMCGGTLEIKEGSTVAECEYCGTLQTLPKFSDEHVSNLYDRANHFRMAGEFDKAEGLYEQILSSSSEDAEAYWSLVLCKYGIIYVEDPTSHKRIPTVNRAQYTSIFDDANYKYAIEYADSSQKEIYKAEAAAINDIQKGILEISNKEEAFDVFICYKETDENGKRTKDSVLANDIYYQLTQEGLKVFFSKITLEDKLGTAYEPYIFSALNSAKVMVVVGTKPEYFNAVWVKNEWSRYLALIKAGQRKTLIPAYRDMDPYDLPEEFSHLQALDMSKIGFIQDLVRGIKKIVDKKENKKPETIEKTFSVSVVGLLKRTKLFLEDSEWNKVTEYCERILDEDPECGLAYFYKFLAKNKTSNPSDLHLGWNFVNEDHDIKKALRFADDELKKQISSIVYNQKKAVYDCGIKCLDEGNYEKAKSFFVQIEDFEDAKEQIEQCKNKIKVKEQQRQYDRAISFMKDSKYSEAIAIFLKIADFKDAKKKAEECQDEIKSIELKKMQDLYNQACSAMSRKTYDRAISLFNQIVNFQDSKDKIKECDLEIDKLKLKAKKRETRKRVFLLIVLLSPLLMAAAYYFIGFVYWNKDESGHWHNLQEHKAHSYSLTVLTEPTCIKKGKGIDTCTVCGYEQVVVIDKVAHTYDDGVITQEPTCGKTGIRTYSCTVCGKTLTESVASTGVHTYENYKCKDCGLWGKGPAGGYVFYDCDADNASGNADGLISTECGWRFLEAAPESLSSTYPFGYYRTSSSGSNLTVGANTAIGTGKANTEALVKAMGGTAYTDSSGTTKGIYAAKACADYSITVDGVVYDDWFLPSKDELDLMYDNLKAEGLGSLFSYTYYWSSSEYSSYNAWRQYFSNGNQGSNGRYSNNYVRPVRAFSTNSGCTKHISDEGIVTKQPTCAEDGIRTYSCSVCGKVLKTEKIAGTHSYVNYKCSVCGLWGKGPTGGCVFYDCDEDNDSGNADGLISSECGWRFLEAAPEDLSDKYVFGYYRVSGSGSNTVVGTSTAVGTGKTNTNALIKAMGETSYVRNSGTVKGKYAAKICSDYVLTVNGVVYDDWFLPSKDELKLMYTNLHKNGIGSFSNSSIYWSSSENGYNEACLQGFSEGSQLNGLRFSINAVRPIRAFL